MRTLPFQRLVVGAKCALLGGLLCLAAPAAAQEGGGLGPKPAPPPPAGQPAGPDLLELPLEQLSQQPVRVAVPSSPPATLTEIAPGAATPVAAAPGQTSAVAAVPRTTPAAVTRIDGDMIWSSGARSINELFDIYVPDVQVIRHTAQQPHLGMRGIISDRDDKYLLRVNDQIMNNHTELGAFSEHYLPMMGDIDHIDFVRGPASAVFGPGAVSGVVNMVTYNGLTFQGLDVIERQGFIEDFNSTEIRYGHKFSEDSGLFLYYGIAGYPGADQEDAPYVFGKSFTARDNIPVIAGEPVTFPIPNDNATDTNLTRQKFHAEYTNGGFDAWVRYTGSGEQVVPSRGTVALPGAVPPLSTAPASAGSSFAGLRNFETGYDQVTVFTSYKQQLGERLSLDFDLSYEMMDVDRINFTGPNYFYREDQYYARVLERWKPVDAQELAVGFEYTHGIFGLPNPRFADQPAYTQRVGSLGPEQPWATDAYSILGEHQWRINQYWTTFLSARVDKDTYTDWLLSARPAVVFTPNEKDTFKFIAAQSVRRVGDDELRFQFLKSGTFSDPETLRGLELRYERQQTDHLWFGMSGYYEDHMAVGFSGSAQRSVLLDEFQLWGLEPEISYRTGRTRLTASYAYTKLLDANALPPTFIQGVSAAPYGFGNDLANWFNHTTKATVAQDLTKYWTVDGSLRVYWDLPGGADLTAFNNSLFSRNPNVAPSDSLGLSDPGYTQAFAPDYFLDFGVDYHPWSKCDIRLDLYNVLGWIDINLNKRNFINRESEYRSEAAAVGLSARLGF